MNCQECISHQDDYLDNQLPHDIHEAMDRHIASCPDCQEMIRRNKELLRVLRNLKAPSPSPGFLKSAMENAARVDRQRRHKKWFMRFAAMAAMICLVVIGTIKFSPQTTTDSNKSSGIVMALHESKDVFLLVQSAQALEGATITIELPPQLTLAGNPAIRELSWRADFQRGKNIIPLPLLAATTGSAIVTAQIEHGHEAKTIRMQVNIIPSV